MIRINSISSYSGMGPRTNQEDYIVAHDNSRIYVLCDGMGGHGHGEVASKTIAESVYNYLSELNPTEYTPDHFQDAINFALTELTKADTFNDERAMGTTVVVIAVNRMNILVGHIGDSRCYQFSEDGVKKYRSRDHSKVQEAVEAEILTEDEAWSSPKKNILTRCVTSAKTSVEIEIDTLEVENNDILLLCSDGVTDAMKDAQLQSFIVDRSIEGVAELIKTECEMSSHDNFSMILLSLNQDEKNLPKTPVEVPERPVHGDVIIDYDRFCPHCGMGLNVGASFCPQCGKSVEQENEEGGQEHGEEQKGNKLDILAWIKGVNPLWLIAGGVIVGSVVTGAICTFASTDDVVVEQQPLLPNPPTNIVTEEDMTKFILSECEVDSGNPADTIIVKHELEADYKTFLEKFNNKK